MSDNMPPMGGWNSKEESGDNLTSVKANLSVRPNGAGKTILVYTVDGASESDCKFHNGNMTARAGNTLYHHEFKKPLDFLLTVAKKEKRGNSVMFYCNHPADKDLTRYASERE